MTSRRQFMKAVAAGATIGVAGRAAGAEARAPLLISVLTCRRPGGASYLRGTLASVDAEVSAAVPRLLVCDGDDETAGGWQSIVLPPRVRFGGRLPDNKYPGWAAIRAADAMGADLIFLEDDIRAIRRGSFSAIVAHKVPAGVAFTSFFGHARPAGIYPARDFRYSQAVKIPRRTLPALIDAERSHPFQMAAVVGVDLAIGVACAIKGWTFEQTPNLVEHVGLYSAANPT